MCQRTTKATRKPPKATRKPQPGEKVVPVRCQPLTYPCPACGRHGRRRHKYDRFVRSLAYGQVLWLHVFYAEYRARCDCRKYYRSCPPDVCPRPTTTTSSAKPSSTASSTTASTSSAPWRR